ncbi:MAG: alpha/beta fold hydrolase [Alphaproteobacteria bacterium]|jgi:2-hydroxy-6-oxonona-2,4-dienedioate hydrolase|nr:alpha/beta fold hydrolase [Alphaproteobacteria bacterium]
MRALIPEAEADPEGWLADIASRARVRETLCADGTMVWHVWGEGEPLVLLHGGHGAWNHWCRNVEPLAAAGFKVIVADLPGLGDSDDPGPPYTADGLADIVHYGINSLVSGDERVHIAGFSFGSVVGAAVAEMLGPNLGSFNMVGAAGFGPRRRGEDAMIKIHPDMSPEELRHAGHNNMAWLMLADPENVAELAIHIQLANSLRARTLSRPISMTTHLLEALPNMLGPVNAIWGDLDKTTMGTLEERIEMLREERPEARVEVLEDVGHWTQFEAADRYNELLVEMIRG